MSGADALLRSMWTATRLFLTVLLVVGVSRALGGWIDSVLAANGLRRTAIAGQGRGVTAERQFLRGDCVLLEDPLAFALSAGVDLLNLLLSCQGHTPAEDARGPVDCPGTGSFPSERFLLPHAADNAHATHCHATLRSAENRELGRCAACRFARYESRAEQERAWPTHRLECARIRRCLDHGSAPPPSPPLSSWMHPAAMRLGALRAATRPRAR